MGVWMHEGSNSYKNCAKLDMKHKGFSIMQICLFLEMHISFVHISHN